MMKESYFHRYESEDINLRSLHYNCGVRCRR